VIQLNHLSDKPTIRQASFPSIVLRATAAQNQQELALKADPFFLVNRYFMARLLICLGDEEKANEHALEAVELSPESWIANGTMGLVHLHKGRIDDAVRSFETTKTAAPIGFVTSGT
jgi:hypothetical protein